MKKEIKQTNGAIAGSVKKHPRSVKWLIDFRLKPGHAYIDTHAHYDHNRFRAKKREELLEQIDADEHLMYVINATIGQQSMFNMREKLSHCDKILFTAGKHPTAAAIDSFDDSAAKAQIEQFAAQERTVAIGETGIDTYRCHGKEQIANQMRWFDYCLALSETVQKPLIIHLRGKGAYRKALQVIKHHGNPQLRGVIHCFCGSYRLYKKCAAAGDFYVGIGGVFMQDTKTGKQLRKALKKIPLEKIVMETDCPFLKPKGYEGRVNTSFSIPMMICEIARIKKVDAQKVARIVLKNSLTLFGLEANR